MTSARVVSYQVDDETVAQFEIVPTPGFVPASAGGVAGRVGEAATPVVEAAKALLDRFTAMRPETVQVRFGVKVTGTSNWLVARSAAEGSFEVTLSWRPRPGGEPAR